LGLWSNGFGTPHRGNDTIGRKSIRLPPSATKNAPDEKPRQPPVQGHFPIFSDTFAYICINAASCRHGPSATVRHRAGGLRDRSRRVPLFLLARDHGHNAQTTRQRRAWERARRANELVLKHS
jgi:hypothetical protein